MIDRITVGASALMGALVAGTGLVRWAVSPVPARRHRSRRPVSDASLLDDLLGPPTPYTTGFEHAPAPIKAALGDCPTCGHVTAGSLNKDGWLCGECLTPNLNTIGGNR